MFKFRINNENAALSEDASLTMRVDNPAFDEDFVFRQFSSSVFLPEGKNAPNLLFNNHINSIATESVATLFLGGIPFDTGIARVKQRRNNGTEYTFQNSAMSAMDKLKSININEILEDIDGFMNSYSGMHFLVNKLNTFVTSADIKINGVWYSVTPSIMNPLPSGTTEAEVLCGLINADYPDLCEVSSPSPNLLFFRNWQKYPNFKIEVFDGNGVIMQQHVSPGEYISEKFTAFANSVATNNDPRICFPMIRAARFYQDKGAFKNPAFLGFINYFNQSFSQNTKQTDLKSENVLIPQVYVKYVIERIALQAGLIISVQDIPEFDKLFFFSNFDNSFDYHDCHLPNLSSNTLAGGTYEHLVAQNFTTKLNDYVPKISAFELIKTLCKAFDLKCDANNKSLILSSKKPNYLRPPMNLTSFSSRDYSIEEKILNGFWVSYKADKLEDVADTPEELAPYRSADGEFVYDLGFNTLGMTNTTIFNRAYYTPYTTIQANSSVYGLTAKIDIVRFLIYRKMQGNVGFYPFATNHNENNTSQAAGELSLRITGDDGLYNKYLRQIIPFLVLEKKVKKRLNLPIALLYKIMHEGVFNIFIRHPKGDAMGVIKELSIKCDNTRYGFVEVETDILLS